MESVYFSANLDSLYQGEKDAPDRRHIIYEKISLAQSGNEDAMLELIQQFLPLLKKYAHLLQTEDALNEFTADLIELVMTLKLNSLKSHCDGILANYINNAMRHKYISRSKQKHQENLILHWADLSEAERRKYEPHCSLFNIKEEFFQCLPLNVLNKHELDIIVQIYCYHYSAAEVARLKHATRQSVNQLKRRALKKLRKAQEKSGHI